MFWFRLLTHSDTHSIPERCFSMRGPRPSRTAKFQRDDYFRIFADSFDRLHELLFFAPSSMDSFKLRSRAVCHVSSFKSDRLTNTVICTLKCRANEITIECDLLGLNYSRVEGIGCVLCFFFFGICVCLIFDIFG